MDRGRVKVCVRLSHQALTKYFIRVFWSMHNLCHKNKRHSISVKIEDKISRLCSVFCRVRTNRTRSIYPGCYPTENSCKLCRAFIPVPGASGSSVRHSYLYPEHFWKFCTPVATIPGVRVQHVFYPLGTSVTSVRLRQNTRNFWKFCKIVIPLPEKSVTPVRLWQNTRGTGILSLQYPGSSVCIQV